MTHLTPNLIGIVVPKDAYDFQVINSVGTYLRYFTKENGITWKAKMIHTSESLKFKIIGTASPEEITFDCEEYVESKISGKLLANIKLFLIYGRRDKIWTINKENSFLSLIESKGITLQENEKLLIIEKL